VKGVGKMSPICHKDFSCVFGVFCQWKRVWFPRNVMVCGCMEK